MSDQPMQTDRRCGTCVYWQASRCLFLMTNLRLTAWKGEIAELKNPGEGTNCAVWQPRGFNPRVIRYARKLLELVLDTYAGNPTEEWRKAMLVSFCEVLEEYGGKKLSGRV